MKDITLCTGLIGGGEEGVDPREQEGLPTWIALYFQSLVL